MTLRVQKLVVHQFNDRGSFSRVLAEATHYKVLYLRRSRLTPRKVYFFFHYFPDLVFTSDFEGNFPIGEFIGEDSDVPDVDLIVILLLLCEFWRGVERSSA